MFDSLAHTIAHDLLRNGRRTYGEERDPDGGGGQLRSEDSTVSDWLRWLEGTDAERRKEAKLRLGGVTPSDGVPLQPLLDAVAAEREPTLFWAIACLGRLERRAAAAAPALRDIVADHYQFGVRQAAVKALASIAPEDARSKECVLAALGDVNPFVRRESLQALILFQGLTPADLAAIKKCVGDADESVARWSEIALRNIRLRRTGQIDP